MFELFSVEELKLAQKYPFCVTAKRVIKSSGVSLEKISEPVFDRARKMIESSLNEQVYSSPIYSYKELLEQEILAFACAKILVSFFKNKSFIEKFCSMFAKKIFHELEQEKDNDLFLLASDVGIKWGYSSSEPFFAQVPVVAFLSADFHRDFMKLVNQRVFGGKVFLSKNEFARLVAFFFEQKLLNELPVDTAGIPKKFSQVASELEKEFAERISKKYENFSFGLVKPESFPPCIEKLYGNILNGRNLSHMERFTLATFMLSVGMPQKSVIELYRATPNFDEKITSYQVSRLSGAAGKKISAPSCAKMQDYGLRLPDCPCQKNLKIKHPLQVYRRAFSLEKQKI